jgi:hypothetical protein
MYTESEVYEYIYIERERERAYTFIQMKKLTRFIIK